MISPGTHNLFGVLDAGPLLFDGGMGTQLIAAGLTTADNAVAWNRLRPEAVQAVHRCYADAGCRVLTTNTFQASRTALTNHGLAEDTAALNTAAAQLARGAADAAADRHGRAVWVAADVGPFGGFLEPLGETTAEQLTDIFVEQFTALREGGADVALIETMSDPAEVAIAIAAARRVADWPVIATFAFEKQGERMGTMMGVEAAEAIGRTIDAGADIVGANCGTALSLDDYIALGGQLVGAAGDVPVIVQPNAGAPRMQGDAHVYDAVPADLARAAVALADAGVKLIGGCCGTTPDHLAAMAQAMKEHADV